MIGVAGSVAVGKSTTSRLLRELLAGWPEHPRVELVTTDGFLLSNAELERRGLMHRKGFPESYDRRALLRFVMEVKSGRAEVTAPVYSHLVYDIVPDAQVVVQRPDILIVEGLNVLQPARPPAGSEATSALAVSDFFDVSIYVDARPEDIARWYVERFLRLRQTAFADPSSYFHRYATLTDEQLSIEQPDIVILEGLTVLQPAQVRGDGRPGLAVSDFFDFSVYVDAAASDIRAWYVRRFLRLRETAFRDPRSYFARYAALSTDEATQQAEQLWDSINGPNLRENIAPTRGRASLVLRKDADHSVRRVRFRKL